MAISVPVASQASIGGSKFCYARFLDQTSTERIQNPDAICGNRDPLINRTAAGRRKVQFSLFYDVTIPILQVLLPLAGTTNAAGTYTANQTISTTEIIVDKVGAIHKYTTCRMDRLILRGQVGTLPVSAETRWIAEDEVIIPSNSFVDGTVDNIFGFPGSIFSVEAAPYAIDKFAFVVDNKLIPSWNSSLIVTDVGMGPRQTLIATTVPYIVANAGLYEDYRDVTTSGTALALSIDNGPDSLTINFPNSVLNPESPSIEGAMEEIRLPMTWEAHRDASTAAFNVVLVNA